jgi:SAM-dependent methyltransferase
LSNEKIPLQKIYQNRFTEDIVFRRQMWQVLCSKFFQKYISREAVVLELGAGYCEFINNIYAEKKIAVDLNRDICNYANKDVEVHIRSSIDLSNILPDSIDVVFLSNFLEHLEREDIILTLQQIFFVLKQGGKLLILQPNYRFCYKDYWMFFDHITPIDDRSLLEILEASGFRPSVIIPRFLPYTTKSAIPRSIFLIKLYLSFPIIWKVLGAQCFILVHK